LIEILEERNSRPMPAQARLGANITVASALPHSSDHPFVQDVQPRLTHHLGGQTAIRRDVPDRPQARFPVPSTASLRQDAPKPFRRLHGYRADPITAFPGGRSVLTMGSTDHVTAHWGQRTASRPAFVQAATNKLSST
jgi:hypothetical protein